jgi:glycosyltransferase involved in cell wall biosynthesis
MFEGKKVSVVIPTYNEEKSIRAVIDGFFATGFVTEVVAVDNNARGNTADEIRKTKARHVVENEYQGYGHAIMRGLREADGDLIVMAEADGTFEPKDIEKLLLYSSDFDAVLGSRTSRAIIWSGAFMPFPVRLGNWAVAKLLEILHNGPTITDVGCTYRLITRQGLSRIKDLFPLSDGGGTFSPEMMIWIFRRDLKSVEIPLMYKPRVGESMYTGSVWKAATLGFRMVVRIIAYRFKTL